jgi:PAS domain S-box-containing protein
MDKYVIICVDDEQTILNSLKIELSKAVSDKYLIEIAEDGEEALELINELLSDGYQIPLIISDYIMPHIRGDELLRQVHLILPRTLKIMLTGQADLDAVGRAINQAGLYRYISKPWQTEDLRLTVVEAVRSYFQTQALTEQHEKLHLLTEAQAQLIQKLHENESRLTQFLEAIPVGVRIVDTQGLPVYANQKAQELLGKELALQSSAQTVVAHHSMFVAGTDEPYPYEKTTLARALQGKNATADDLELRSQGRTLRLESQSTPIFNSDGRIDYGITVFQDVTERKLAEKTLRLTRFSIDKVADIILWVGRDARLLYVNEAASRVLGYSHQELCQMTIHEIDAQFPSSKWLEHWEQLKRQGTFSFESEYRTKYGFTFAVEVTVNFLEFNGEEYDFAFVRDISARKQMEAERTQAAYEIFQLNKAYERFVPREFLSLLDKKSIVDVRLGEQVRKEMTILFSDIRGFTSLSEKMTPKETFDFLNGYFGRMEPVILQHSGVIDKYIGDAIMALFPLSADDAVCGSIAMLRTLREYNKRLLGAGMPLIKVGIGLNSGPLILGTIGGQNRMEGTVIADAVNLASRVEGLTKIYDTPLLITEHTHIKLRHPHQYNIRLIDAVTVKGKTEEVTIYEIFDADMPEMIALKRATLSEFEQGFVLYHSDEHRDATQLFEEVLASNPEDKVAQIYLKRCLEGKRVEELDYFLDSNG